MGILVVAALAISVEAGIRGDHGGLTTNQIGRQGGQSIKLTLGPAIFDCDVLAFDVAEFFETVP